MIACANEVLRTDTANTMSKILLFNDITVRQDEILIIKSLHETTNGENKLN